jgi:hypothetical protein
MLVVRSEGIVSEMDGLSLANAGGVSGTVLDDLSGTYKTFAEAVKEAISNAYDADAQMVRLEFGAEYQSLTIDDDGAGMNPKQFVREYIRVGRSPEAKVKSPSEKRERIGGKGIGSLAPARYCRQLNVKTWVSQPMYQEIELQVPSNGYLQLAGFFPLDIDATFPDLFYDMQIQVADDEGEFGAPTPAAIGGVYPLPPGCRCRVTYRFLAQHVYLDATIDFVHLRRLGEYISLDQVASLWDCKVRLREAEGDRLHGTLLTLEGLEDFVVHDLNAPGKTGARNIGSKGGIDRFLWTLARICPVPVRNVKNELERKLPGFAAQVLRKDPGMRVSVSHPRGRVDNLTREVYLPQQDYTAADEALTCNVDFAAPELGLEIRGYILGSSTMIYPAELRGISLRVKGVELGAPTLFGAEKLAAGPQHTALTGHLTGELHLKGVDVRRDILPGREGLYPESPVYRTIRRLLTGGEERLGGLLGEIVSVILLRSESHASAVGLVKKLELQRKALLDAAGSIATMAENDEEILERLMTPPENEPTMLLAHDVQVRPEGKLAAFTVDFSDVLTGKDMQIDYDNRRLILPKGASFREQTVDIAGVRFHVFFKQAAKERVFCEVDPDARQIFINWEHPVRGAMGDAAYIKHCLAAVVCGLPQAALNRYVQMIATRS